MAQLSNGRCNVEVEVEVEVVGRPVDVLEGRLGRTAGCAEDRPVFSSHH
ncbi:MAG: hypothetical protein MJK10_12365 [Pseudomonadales bacterium]|nr:hypothetical protein [Pseudomonadales bacterium]NRA16801.1 hypothetical protein [Oceanospirillaceae bacterium]